MDINLIYGAQISSIIRTVLERCQTEHEQNALQIPIEQVEERVTHYTGFPKASISQIMEDPNHDKAETCHKSQSYFDIPERTIINNTLIKYYSERKYPNYLDVYETVKNSLNTEDFIKFKNEMINLGYNYTPVIGGLILSEDPRLRFERYHYLNKIRKFRKQNAKLVYVDVRLVTLITSKELEEKDYVEGKILNGEYIFIHAIANRELLSYLFCNKMSRDVFKNWIFDTLIPTLKPGTVIVMNNHCLLGDMIDYTMTRYHLKTDMINWLQNNNIPCNEEMHKADLYDLIEKCSKKGKQYIFDELLRVNGYEVLYVPFNCKKLSLTVFLWDEMDSDKLKDPKLSTHIEVQNNIVSRIAKILKIHSLQFYKSLIESENTTFTIDCAMEELLDTNYSFDAQKIKSDCS